MTEFIALLYILASEVEIKLLPKEHCQQSTVEGRYFYGDFSINLKGEVFDKGDIGICSSNINGKIPRKKMVRNVIHELGHHYWYNHMNKGEKAGWIELNKLCNTSECFARDYGMVNHREDFATMFEAFLFIGEPSDVVLALKKIEIEILTSR